MTGARWAMTLASGKLLTDQESAEIARSLGAYSIGLVGKVEGSRRWDYNVYVLNTNEITEEGAKYLKSQKIAVASAGSNYSHLFDMEEQAKALSSLHHG